MSWAVWLAIGIVVWLVIACGLSYAFTRALFEPSSDASIADIELRTASGEEEAQHAEAKGARDGRNPDQAHGRADRRDQAEAWP